MNTRCRTGIKVTEQITHVPVNGFHPSDKIKVQETWLAYVGSGHEVRVVVLYFMLYYEIDQTAESNIIAIQIIFSEPVFHDALPVQEKGNQPDEWMTDKHEPGKYKHNEHAFRGVFNLIFRHE